MSDFCVSLWLLTDTYSPNAMEIAPPTRPAVPAARMLPVLVVAPATPTTIAATETMPSFAPKTPARSQFSLWARSSRCGSFSCVVAVSAEAMFQAKHRRAALTSMARLAYPIRRLDSPGGGRRQGRQVIAVELQPRQGG